MAISSRFFFPPSSSGENHSDMFVGSIKNDEDMKAVLSEKFYDKDKKKDLRKYSDVNNIDLYVLGKAVVAGYGRVLDVETALQRLEERVWDYLFGDTPARAKVVPEIAR